MHQVNLKDKRLVVVLGMHRSGTSAVMKAMETLGVYAGTKLMPGAKENNEKGFFEDMDIYALNEAMLSTLKKRWDHLSFVEQTDVDYLCAKGYFEQAVMLIQDKLRDTSLFGFKEPRTTKLISFWKRVFDFVDCKVDYVLSLRAPQDVAMSLNKRDSMDLYKGELLWLSYLYSALTTLEKENYIVVNYDLLVEQPEAELIRLAKNLDLIANNSAVQSYVNSFIDKSLRHHENRDSAFGSALSNAIYNLLEMWASRDIAISPVESAANLNKLIMEYQTLKRQFIYLDKLNNQLEISLGETHAKQHQIEVMSSLLNNNKDNHAKSVEICSYFGWSENGVSIFEESYSTKHICEYGQGKITLSFPLPKGLDKPLSSIRFDIADQRCLAYLYDISISSHAKGLLFSWHADEEQLPWDALVGLDIIDKFRIEGEGVLALLSKNDDPQVLLTTNRLGLDSDESDFSFNVTLSLYPINEGQVIAFSALEKAANQLEGVINAQLSGVASTIKDVVNSQSNRIVSELNSDAAVNVSLIKKLQTNLEQLCENTTAQEKFLKVDIARDLEKIGCSIKNGAGNFHDLNQSLQKALDINTHIGKIESFQVSLQKALDLNSFLQKKIDLIEVNHKDKLADLNAALVSQKEQVKSLYERLTYTEGRLAESELSYISIAKLYDDLSSRLNNLKSSKTICYIAKILKIDIPL